MHVEEFGLFSNTGVHRKIPIEGVYYRYGHNLGGSPFSYHRLPHQYIGTKGIVQDQSRIGDYLMDESFFQSTILPLLLGKVGLIITDNQFDPEFKLIYALQRSLSGLLKIPLIRETVRHVPISTPSVIQVMFGIESETMDDICKARFLPCIYEDFKSKGGPRFLL